MQMQKMKNLMMRTGEIWNGERVDFFGEDSRL